MATDIIARGMAAEAEKTANKYKAGANIVFTENADGTVAIEASGEVSSEDTVARNLINNHKENTDNPHGVTAEQIGLGNVDNTSDLEKPISNAMQDALDKKVDSNNLGTTAYKDVPIDGDASDSQVVLGNDSRLSDSRKADGGNADTLETHPASDFVMSSDFEAHAGNAEIHVTAEEKAAWNAVNYSNPNLLINPDFAVNQRGKSDYTTGFSVDCWKCNNITLNANGGTITLTKADGISQGELVQRVEGAYKSLAGKTVTISCADVDGNIIKGTATIPAEQPAATTNLTSASSGNVWITFSWSVTGRFYFRIWLRGSAALTYSPAWCKVEVGEVATPFVPRLAAEELTLCQRFYQIHSTNSIAAVDLRPSMATIKDIALREDGNYGYTADV